MQHYKPGDRARIIAMPEQGSGLVGQLVTVATLGGLGNEPDDLSVVTSAGQKFFVKEHQLLRLEPSEQTSS